MTNIEPRFFEPYNPLRDDYIPKFHNSSNESKNEHFSNTIDKKKGMTE